MNTLIKRKESDKEIRLTGYDLFMQEKYGEYLTKSADSITKASSLDTQNNNKLSNSIREKIKSMSLKVGKNSYKEELVTKLRGTGEGVDYFQDCQNEEKAADNNREEGKKLSKVGKIFILVYVIITISLASTLLWVNMDGAVKIDANANAASGYEQVDSIVPLAQEEEAVSTNWFDRLCDSLNKS